MRYWNNKGGRENTHFDNEWDIHTSPANYEEVGYGHNLDPLLTLNFTVCKAKLRMFKTCCPTYVSTLAHCEGENVVNYLAQNYLVVQNYLVHQQTSKWQDAYAQTLPLF